MPMHTRSRPPQTPTWLVIAIFVVIAAISLWHTTSRAPHDSASKSRPTADSRDQDSNKQQHESRAPIAVDVTPESDSSSNNTAIIRGQMIRDQNGRVVFRGDIDLQPTLDRIGKGRHNSHRNDGSTFQNRERRLPAKPSGYYREYVHPTPGLEGPGPQRVIVGADGDVWYTPDHYRSFKQIR